MKTLLSFISLVCCLSAQTSGTLTRIDYSTSLAALRATHLVMYCGICVDLDTGEVSLPKDMPLSEATKAFWKSLFETYPRDVLVNPSDLHDIVRAMEILDSASQPNTALGLGASAGIVTTTDAVYRPYGFSAAEKAAMAREDAARYEAQAKAEAEQYEHVKWARSILAKWKAKTKGN